MYPDLHLHSALSYFSVAYQESEIAATVRNRFLHCWGLAFLPENPPNGEYFSEDDDTIVMNGDYWNPLWDYRKFVELLYPLRYVGVSDFQ